MSETEVAEVSNGARIGELADATPDGVAIIFGAEDGTDRPVTWAELDEGSTQLAHVLADRGVGIGDRLAIRLRNSPEHLMACFAGWKVGAVVVPMRWDLPEWERGRLLDTIDPAEVIDAQSSIFEESRRASAHRLPDVVSPNGWGVCSSGSTGSPKVIVMNSPGVFVPGGAASTIVEEYGPLPEPQRVLVPAPLYHTNGFTATRNLLGGIQVVLMERFNAERLLDLVERHRVTGFIGATPMLQRIVAVDGVEKRDLSSLDWVQQGAAPLPVWLGRSWCELVGPEHFYLSYGASEAHGLITCRGDEWLSHPGTLGRPALGSEIMILDADHKELPPGEVGSIYLRSPNGLGAFYVGRDVAPIPVTDDGFATVGDLGWVDEDGFVFLADRRSDMIVTGAVNVFPAEVESALSEHPRITDVVVIGLSDPEWGKRVHAIVVPVDSSHPPSAESIIEYAKGRLAPYKVPKSVEFVESLPRSDAMKLNRAQLLAEREPPPGGGSA